MPPPIGGGAANDAPSSPCFPPLSISHSTLADLEAQNAGLPRQVRELAGSVNGTFVGESGASFDPLNPASLSNPLAQTLACRVLNLERDNLQSDFKTATHVHPSAC